MAATEVVIGRVGRAHGVRGEVSVEPRTDEPERRFAVGSVLMCRSATGEGVPAGVPSTLTVAATRVHQSRLLVTFDELGDRSAAESARGLLLAVAVDADEHPEDPEEFYDHQLVGLAVETTEGQGVGTVAEVLHTSAQDLLSVRAAGDGREILIPFVSQLVPVVDLAGGRLEVVDVPGLLSPAVEDEEGGA